MPTIDHLRIDPASRLTSDGQLTLRWQTAGNDRATLRWTANDDARDYLLARGATSYEIGCPPAGHHTFRLTLGGTSLSAEAMVREAVTGALVADKTVALPGACVRLAWHVEHAGRLLLCLPDGSREAVAAEGMRCVRLATTATYALEAEGTPPWRQALTVQVAKHCAVRFEAACAYTFPGVPVALRWAVSEAEAVCIDGLGDQPPAGEREVSPAQTTTYTLRARDAYGETVRQLTVRVLPVPAIKAMTVPVPVLQSALRVSIHAPRFVSGTHYTRLALRPLHTSPAVAEGAARLAARTPLLRPRLYKAVVMRWLLPLFRNKNTL